MSKNLDHLIKTIQTRILTFLTTGWGVTLCVLGVFLLAHSLLRIVQLLLQAGPTASPFCLNCCATNYADNLAETSFEGRMCLPPVDVVYTWVNGSDPLLQEALAIYRPVTEPPTPAPADSNETVTVELIGGSNRFRDNQELRYSLRSIWKYAPWVRHVHIVTNGQLPNWLNLEHPRISVVPHTDIFPDKSHLPVFSSPAIESHIHQIPGLADHFIYFNDDTMLGNVIWPDDFFTQSKGAKVFLSWGVPNCAEGCPDNWIGDGYCDRGCNVTDCEFDGGDCDNVTTASGSRYGTWQGSGASYSWQSSSRYCASGCPTNWVGDKVCDRACKHVDCAYDAGDCGIEDLMENVPCVDLTDDMDFVDLSYYITAFYVNLTAIFPVAVQEDEDSEEMPIDEHKIVEASHDNGKFIRSATINQQYKTLTIVFQEEAEVEGESEATVEIVGLKNGENHVVTFNITRELAPPVSEEEGAFLMEEAGPDDVVQADKEANGRTDNSGDKGENINRGDKGKNINRDDPDDQGDQDESNVRRKLLWMSPDSSPTLSSPEVPTLTPEDLDLQDFQWAFSGYFIPPIIIDRIPDSNQPDARSVPVDSENSDDVFVANWIANAKEKELAMYQKLDRERAEEQIKYRSKTLMWPWELREYVDRQVLLESLSLPLAESPLRAPGRRLLDTFGDSLRYVNQLYNKHFGPDARKAPAHMPHFINKNIQNEIHAMFPEQFEATSSHRFRSGTDMQFSFSYFYYIMNQKEKFDIDEHFNHVLDLDGDGLLNELETRTLAARVSMTESYTWGVTSESRKQEIVEELWNITAQLVEQFDHPNNITVDTVYNTKSVMNKLEEDVTSSSKYPFELMELGDVEFYMVGNNFTSVQRRLDDMRAKRPKFICLNDDMNKTHDPDPRLLQSLHEFFTTYYPEPSPFELWPGYENKFLHLDEIAANEPITFSAYIGYSFMMICGTVGFYLLFQRYGAQIGLWLKRGQTNKDLIV